MPRKKSEEQLGKVISSIISLEDFKLLEKYTRFYYTQGTLKQPTISHIVRHILKVWASQIRKAEEQNRKSVRFPSLKSNANI